MVTDEATCRYVESTSATSPVHVCSTVWVVSFLHDAVPPHWMQKLQYMTTVPFSMSVKQFVWLAVKQADWLEQVDIGP